jgi:hypothetical protein
MRRHHPGRGSSPKEEASMAQTNDEAVVRDIVREFEIFEAAYDRYMQQVDEAVCTLDETLKDKAAPLVLDAGEVGIFFRDAGYLVDSLRIAVKGPKSGGLNRGDTLPPTAYPKLDGRAS